METRNMMDDEQTLKETAGVFEPSPAGFHDLERLFRIAALLTGNGWRVMFMQHPAALYEGQTFSAMSRPYVDADFLAYLDKEHKDKTIVLYQFISDGIPRIRYGVLPESK